VDITDTINAVELSLFLLALLGLLVTLVLLPGVAYAIVVVRSRRANGMMRRFTHADLREEGQRAWRLLGYTMFSGLAMMLPSAQREGQRDTANWFLVFIITCVLGDVANSVAAAFDRQYNLRDAAKLRAPDSHSKPPDVPHGYLPTGEGENGPQNGPDEHTGHAGGGP
jgi:hypothetical protein